MVRGTVPAPAVPALIDAYRAATADPPPAIVWTELLTTATGSVAIVTTWRDREALEEMLASGQEPLARRLVREAGGEPTVEIFDLSATASP